LQVAHSLEQRSTWQRDRERTRRARRKGAADPGERRLADANQVTPYHGRVGGVRPAGVNRRWRSVRGLAQVPRHRDRRALGRSRRHRRGHRRTL